MSQPQSTLGGSASRRTSRVGREAASEQHDMSQERWLLTYADMITLLLVLFIVLFALSKINQAKYRQFQQSVSHVKLVGSSVAHGSTPVASRGPAPLSAASDHLREIEQVLSHALALKGLPDPVETLEVAWVPLEDHVLARGTVPLPARLRHSSKRRVDPF